MQIKNTQNNFGILSILLHWLVALMVIGLFLLGKYMVDLDYYDNHYHKAPWWHKSIGLTLLVLIVFRVIWTKINISPKPLSTQSFEIKISFIVHILLYLLLFMSCISGYLISTAENAGVSLYDWIEVPAILSNGRQQADVAGIIHEYSTTILIILATFHMLASLKHHFINKNKTLIRMLTTK